MGYFDICAAPGALSVCAAAVCTAADTRVLVVYASVCASGICCVVVVDSCTTFSSCRHLLCVFCCATLLLVCIGHSVCVGCCAPHLLMHNLLFVSVGCFVMYHTCSCALVTLCVGCFVMYRTCSCAMVTRCVCVCCVVLCTTPARAQPSSVVCVLCCVVYHTCLCTTVTYRVQVWCVLLCTTPAQPSPAWCLLFSLHEHHQTRPPHTQEWGHEFQYDKRVA